MCPWIQCTVNTHPSQSAYSNLAPRPHQAFQTGWWQWCEAVVVDQGNSVWASVPKPAPPAPTSPSPLPVVVSRARRDPRAFRFGSPDLFIFITTMKISMMPNAYARCTPPRLFVCTRVCVCACVRVIRLRVCVCVGWSDSVTFLSWDQCCVDRKI